MKTPRALTPGLARRPRGVRPVGVVVALVAVGTIVAARLRVQLDADGLTVDRGRRFDFATTTLEVAQVDRPLPGHVIECTFRNGEQRFRLSSAELNLSDRRTALSVLADVYGEEYVLGSIEEARRLEKARRPPGQRPVG